MRRHLTPANVLSALALCIALGGTSYAAMKVRGKDVVNGSLTGKDIKKRSVPLNRLKGKLPAGARGPAGSKGDQGPKGDPGQQGPPGTPDGYTKADAHAQFVEPGETVLPVDLLAVDFTGETVGTAGPVFNSWTRDTPGTAVMSAIARTPGMFDGRPARLVALHFCGNSSASRYMSQIELEQRRITVPPVVQVVSTSVHSAHITDAGCHRVDLAEPVAFAPGDFARLQFTGAWTGEFGTHLYVGGLSAIWERG